jgi:dynein intermediate chain
MPVMRSGISADAHKYPVCSLNVVGTQIANNVVSFSNDGMMCMWDIKQFSKPTRMNKLTANRSQRAAPKTTPLTNTLAANRSLRPDTSVVSNNTSILDRTAKEEVHDINITCCEFPQADANNYYIGSLNGVLYKNALHNKGTDKITMYDEHNGPISGLSVNKPSEFDALNNLVLTSSFDWTVKLWSPDSKESLRTFEHS